MTDRPTASTIPDAQLDELHQRLAGAEAAIARVRAVVHVADDGDVTDWQRGFRACSVVALAALDEPAPPPRDCRFARDGAWPCLASDPCATCDQPKEQP